MIVVRARLAVGMVLRGRRFRVSFQETVGVMKAKNKHRKSGKWRRRADSSPVAKGRRVKHHGVRNPRKRKHLGGKGL